MTEEAILRDKLRKIEALFAGAATLGERAAADAAAQRIRVRLKQTEKSESAVDFRFRLPDPWSRQLFVALCRRYGLRVYRRPRMHRQNIMVKAPRSFVAATLWPEFREINAALVEYLAAITDRVICEEVWRESPDVEEEAQSARGRGF